MTSTDATYRDRILRVQLYIQEHLDEPLPLEALARVAHFSPYHFHRIFTGVVGEGVREYVRRLRLESAAVNLKTTTRPVTRVAFDAGYDTHEAFTRAFRQHFGVSPSQFRAGRHPLFRPKEGSTMTASTTDRTVRVETFPPRRVAFVRHVGPYEAAEPAFERLKTWAAGRRLFGPDTLMLGVCHDDPDVTPADKIRFDCCVTVPDSVQAEGDLGVQTVGGGEYAVLTQYGPYTHLGEAYRWLYGAWLPTSGREPGDAPPFEVYHGDPRTTPPEQLRTDIYVPLKPR